MKKNVIILILFYFICIFSNCSDKKHVGIEYQILNQNFISIVDTIAYDYNSLRPEPNNIPLKKRKSEYSITVFDKFIDIKVWENTIKEALRKCGLKLENSNYFVLNFSLTYWNGLQKGLPHQKL